MPARAITGNLVDIGADPIAGVRVTISRTGVVSQDGDVVLPQSVTITSGAGGALSTELLPGNYTAFARLRNGPSRFEFPVPEGSGALDLADLLEEAQIVQTPDTVLEAREARDDAIAAIAAVPLTRDAYSTVADLLADTILTNSNTVLGQVIWAGGLRYQRAASGASDHHVTTAGGVKLYVMRGDDGKFAVGAFNINPGATDHTSSYAAMVLAVHNAGGGIIKFGAGEYVGTFPLTTSVVDTVSIEGVYGATILRAPTDGAFALTLKNNQFPPEPFYAPMIRNIGFSGNNASGVKNYRCGIYAPRRVHLENVVFHRCLIGMVQTDNYYGHWIGLNFDDCDIGLLQGTYGTGNETITDLVNGAGGAATVTLPEAAANSAGHSGNKGIYNLRIEQCRIGWAMEGTSSGVPLMLVSKGTIEQCQIGVLMARGSSSARLESIWLENFPTSGTTDFNGNTYQKGSISSEGGVIEVASGRCERIYQSDDGTVRVNDVFLTVSPTGKPDLDMVTADLTAFPHVIRRPRNAFQGRGISCYTTPKVQRVYNTKPTHGRVLVADDLTGVAAASSKWSKNVGTIAWGESDGFFGTCIKIPSTDIYGINFDISGDITDDKFYVVTMGVFTPEAATLEVVNLANSWGPPLLMPANEWTTLCMVSQFTNGIGGGLDPRIAWEGLTGTQDILYSGFQVLEFDTADAAANHCATNFFYMTES